MLHFTITRRTISYYNQDNIQFWWWWSGFKNRCALIYFIKLGYVVNQWPFFRITFKTGLAIFKLIFWISCKTPESITKTDAFALVNFLNMIWCCLQTLQIHLIQLTRGSVYRSKIGIELHSYCIFTNVQYKNLFKQTLSV